MVFLSCLRAPAFTSTSVTTHPPTKTFNTMSAVTMNAITVKASAFTAGRVSLRTKSAVAAKPRGMTVMAYKVTLETPEGKQEIECADDTYILDAAEVRRVRGGSPFLHFAPSRDRSVASRSLCEPPGTSDGFAIFLGSPFAKPCTTRANRVSPIASGFPTAAPLRLGTRSARPNRRLASTSPTPAARARARPARARSPRGPSTSPTSLSSMTTRWARASPSPASRTPPPTAPSRPTWYVTPVSKKTKIRFLSCFSRMHRFQPACAKAFWLFGWALFLEAFF